KVLRILTKVSVTGQLTHDQSLKLVPARRCVAGFPLFLLMNRVGKTSSRPRKRERNSFTFAAGVLGTGHSAAGCGRTRISSSAPTVANSAWNAASRLLPSACSASSCAKRVSSRAIASSNSSRCDDGCAALTLVSTGDKSVLLAARSGCAISKVIDAARQIANELEQHVHRGRLNVSARLPAGHSVRSESQQARQIRLRETEPLADRVDLVSGQQPVLLSVDRDRVLVKPFRVLEPENDLCALRAVEVNCVRDRDLLAVDWQAQRTALLNHVGPASRASIVGQDAPAPRRWSFLATSLFHGYHPRPRETKPPRSRSEGSA